jgi:hypothetical protein
MEEIHFEIGERDDPVDGTGETVVIFVNDRDLPGITREVELPFAARDGKPELAGNHVGLPPETVFLPSHRLLGRTEGCDEDWDGKFAVLGCGVVGCWPLRVKTTPREATSLWHDFKQPQHRHWRQDGLEPLIFSRAPQPGTLHVRAGPKIRRHDVLVES